MYGTVPLNLRQEQLVENDIYQFCDVIFEIENGKYAIVHNLLFVDYAFHEVYIL